MTSKKKLCCLSFLLFLLCSLLASSYFSSVRADASGAFGFSAYPTNNAGLDAIISAMGDTDSTLYRYSSNPEWFSSKPHPYDVDDITYFLAHSPSNYKIIVDRNHIYPPDESGAADFRANKATAIDSILEVCAAFPNNSRVLVELFNEYVSSDFHTQAQDLLDQVRGGGGDYYTNGVVVNKWNTAWSTAVLTDPSNNYYSGYHFYFNSWSVSGAISQVNTALSYGLKLINTEVGADYNEEGSFTQGTVDETEDFFDQCYALGVDNCLWQFEDMGNWDTYGTFNFEMPYVEETNLMPLSSFYTSVNDHSNYAIIDTSVTHNGHSSIRIIGGQSPYPWGEINGDGITISAGDHVIAGIWCKTEAHASSGVAPGSFFCFDLKATTNLGFGILGATSDTQAGHPVAAEYTTRTSINNDPVGWSEEEGNTLSIPFGTDWTYLEWDFTVPATYYGYVWLTGDIYDVDECTPIQAQILLPSLGVRNEGWAEAGYVWYSEPTFYINPSEDPVPTATPVPSVTPSPSPTAQPVNAEVGGVGSINPLYILLGLAGMGLVFWQVVKEKT